MISEIISGIFSYIEALYVAAKYKLYKYIILIFLLLLVFIFPVFLFDLFITGLSHLIPYAESGKYADMGVSFAAGFSGFFLLLVLSPIFSMVSEEVTQNLAGKIYRFSLTQLLKDVLRGIRIAFRNLFYEYLAIVIISIILHFLPENVIVSISGKALLFLITSYFYGFSIMDYALENHRINYNKSVTFVRTHAGFAIGLGSVYYAIISLNDIEVVKQSLGHLAVYWSGFAEALVAFVGVVGASILVSRVLEKKQINLG
jgi:uncharacterized protein involved in cysteine biosynthesis